MFKKVVPLMLLVLLLSVMLTACGGNNASGDLPKYGGAKTLTMSDAAKKGLKVDEISKKGGKIEAFSTGDETSKVKSFYADELKKQGWAEDKSMMDATTMQGLSAFDSMGGFALIYSKGDQAVMCLGLPGSIAGNLGFSEVGQKDTLIIVGSGSKDALRAK